MIKNSDSSSYPVKTETLHKANVGSDGYIAGRADVNNNSLYKELVKLFSGTFVGLTQRMFREPILVPTDSKVLIIPSFNGNGKK